jgi:hypothetical protein
MRHDSGRGLAIPPEPWRSFLQELEERLRGKVELRCLGGFVVTLQYGIGRATSDIEFLSIVKERTEDDVEVIAGLRSNLHLKYRLYVQYVGVATPPCNWESRLRPMFRDATWKHLRLFALDPMDLALSKLERNSERDREDLLGLARAGLVDPDELKFRYLEEVRPYLLSKHSWHDESLELWLQMMAPPKE